MINKFTEGNEFLKNYVKDKEYLYVTVITKEYLDLCKNWYFSLKNINSENKGLIICFDKKSYDDLVLNNLPCVYIDYDITNENILSDETYFKRIYIINHILKIYKIDIILCDVDIIFLKDPIDKLKEELKLNGGYDCLVSSANIPVSIDIKNFLASNDLKNNIIRNTQEYDNGMVDLNFFYLPYSDKVEKASDYLLDFDDVTFRSILSENNYTEEYQAHFAIDYIFEKFNIKRGVLNLNIFPNGSILSKPYKDNILKNAYVLHYNNLDFTANDIAREHTKKQIMIDNNHWFLGNG